MDFRPLRRIGPARLWDDISEAPMSTEFAISRFLTPTLAETGWALFVDSDVLVRRDIHELFDLADSKKAVMCVKHAHEPPEHQKMNAQEQLRYARKNWSSVVLYNCDHPANKRLTVEMVNTLPGRDLHRFVWLEDSEIGELSIEWNWLVGYSNPKIAPKLAHFTNGVPLIPGYENVSYADEWRTALTRWAQCS